MPLKPKKKNNTLKTKKIMVGIEGKKKEKKTI
jgi:hypothetical protein